jgi:hypothetical protein
VRSFIGVKQQKTGERLSITLASELSAAIAAYPSEHSTFLITEAGKPFASSNAFYNWFKACARAAGVRLAYPLIGCARLRCGGRLHTASDRRDYGTHDADGSRTLHENGRSEAAGSGRDCPDWPGGRSTIREQDWQTGLKRFANKWSNPLKRNTVMPSMAHQNGADPFAEINGLGRQTYSQGFIDVQGFFQGLANRRGRHGRL